MGVCKNLNSICQPRREPATLLLREKNLRVFIYPSNVMAIGKGKNNKEIPEDQIVAVVLPALQREPETSAVILKAYEKIIKRRPRSDLNIKQI